MRDSAKDLPDENLQKILDTYKRQYLSMLQRHHKEFQDLKSSLDEYLMLLQKRDKFCQEEINEENKSQAHDESFSKSKPMLSIRPSDECMDSPNPNPPSPESPKLKPKSSLGKRVLRDDP